MSSSNSPAFSLLPAQTQDLMAYAVSNTLSYGPNDIWKKEWNVPWRWCKEHAGENIFKLLVDVFNLQSHQIKELPFKNIFDLLYSEHSRKILQAWAINDPNCAQLYQLSNTAKKDFKNELSLISNIAKASASSGKELSLKYHYMLLIFLQREAHFKLKNDNWMLTFRVWLLIHAIYRVERGVFFDKNLSVVAAYLNALLYAKKFEWDDLLLLKPPESEFISFGLLNSSMINRISVIRSGTHTKRFKLFVGAVERIARGIDDSYCYDSALSIQIKPLYEKLTEDKKFSINKNDSNWIHQLAHHAEDSVNESFVESYVEADDSYIHQKLSAESRYLQTTEYLHFLPFSWDRPTPLEINDLYLWIDQSLRSKNPAVKLLSIFTWIALKTARTLVRVLDFKISSEVNREWTLDPLTLNLYRKSSIRDSSWIPRTQEEREWVTPVASFNRIALPKQSKKFLQKMTADFVGDKNYLCNFWRHVSDNEIDFVFNQSMYGHLDRLKSGMLANVLSQSTFDTSNNHNLAQMIGYHPQLSISGALAYASWDCMKVNKVTAKIHECLDSAYQKPEGKVIAIGSRFDPVETLLQSAIQNANNQLLAINSSDDPVVFHNAYISYLMEALWAGTGGRPVENSFESPNHFNLEEGYVFINDKAVDENHLGRLAPLPSKLCEILKTTYQQHLVNLSRGFELSNPTFTQEIKLLIQKKPTGNLPYFFYIDPVTLNWQSISARMIMQKGIFVWPLRNNLFRQRLAKRLPNLGVNQEIVDGWLGHKDASLDSYGDYSIRCWLDDLRAERCKVDLAFDSLGFLDFSTWDQSPVIASVKACSFSHQSYGIKLRAEQRKKRHDQVIDSAQSEISSFLGDRHIVDLEQNEMDRLENMLAMLPNKKTHPHAFLRLNLLSQIWDEQWENKTKRFRVSRRLIHIKDGFTHVKDSCGYNQTLFKNLRKQFDELYLDVLASRVSITDSRLLAVFGLMFENRLSYSKLLTDVYNFKNFRLIKYKKRFYLEYSEELNLDDMLAPAQRHRLSPKTAHLLNNLLKSKKMTSKIPELCQSLAKQVESLSGKSILDPDDLINKFSSIVNESNIIELPGTVAAFLSGRVQGTSLNLHDMVRLDQNKLMHLQEQTADSNPKNLVDEILKSESFKYHSSVSVIIEKQQLQKNAKVFYDEIRKVLKEYNPSCRKNTTMILNKLINQHSDKVSTAIQMVARWIRHQIEIGRSKGGKAYAKSSPDRYFSAISSKFEQLAYDKDLLAMESDEITELYSEFLESCKSLTGTYSVDRLLDFHRYCESEGVEQPDWDELDLPVRTRIVCPGIVTETDYDRALSLILANKKTTRIFKLHMAFLLLLGFRFGLRAMEGIGLRRHDWVDQNENLYLLVRNNRLRKLKSHGSRRIVPLLFLLKEKEQQLIAEVLANYESLHHDDDRQYLFSIEGNSINSDIEIIRRSLNLLLKQMTGNPKIFTHHLRHSFSNITSISLYHLDLKSWSRFMGKSCNPSTVRSITLGKQQQVSSRNTMAAARLLGHTHPGTDAKSYQHFYDDWSNTLAGVYDKPTDKVLDGAIDLDNYPMSAPVSLKLSELYLEDYQSPTFVNLLQVFSLVANGKSFETAGRMLSIELTHIDKLASIVTLVGHKGKKKLLSTSTGIESTGHDWLARIPRSAWQRLITLAIGLKDCSLPEKDSLIAAVDISNLIGKSRQITLWQEDHFHTIQQFIHFIGLPTKLFAVTSYMKNNPLESTSAAFGFKVDPKIRRSDLDVGISNQSPAGNYTGRINLIFKENKTHDIRNSYQLAVCLIALLLSTQLNK